MAQFELELPITVRATEPADAAGIVALQIDRLDDITPGHPEYTQAQAARLRDSGVDALGRFIASTLADPEHNFSRVATWGKYVVGFAHVYVPRPPDDERFVVWGGMAVAWHLERYGIGDWLEVECQKFAVETGRIALAEVPAGNSTAQRHLREHGFGYVGALKAARQIPFSRSVYQIPRGERGAWVLQTRKERLQAQLAISSSGAA